MPIKQKGAPDWWNNDQWATPQWFVKRLALQFCRPALAGNQIVQFDLDPCATKSTAKAPKYYTIDDNGLKKKWLGRVFVNPPFSNPLPWVRKAARQVEKGNADVVVMLLPCSMATNWFHEWVLPYAQIHYIKGRIAFEDWKGRPKSGNRYDCFIAAYVSGGLRQEYATLSFESKR